MDAISIRVAGYEYALRTPPEHDVDVMDAYARLCGGSWQDDGFQWFQFGVDDAAAGESPVLSLADAARMAGMSDAYLRQEVANGRLNPTGTGKNRRISWRQFREWMSNPRRGSRK